MSINASHTARGVQASTYNAGCTCRDVFNRTYMYLYLTYDLFMQRLRTEMLN